MSSDLVFNIIGMVSAVLLPIIIFMLNRVSSIRQREHEQTTVRLERIENGMVERIARVEAKIDAHLLWHLPTPRRDDP